MNPFRTKSAAAGTDPSPAGSTAARRRRSSGQVIVIFAGAMLAFMGLMAIVIDVSWYWANTLRVQRAADAAALAGVVWLPNLYSSADTTARAEATKNGYTAGVNGTTITTLKDPSNDRRLIVTIGASTPSFFARVIGINSFPINRTSKAEFILPVAMGSPENYYGVFGAVRDATFTGTTPGSTSWDPATAAVTGGAWSNPTRADNVTDDNQYAVSGGNGTQQSWHTFHFTNGGSPQIPSGATIDGVQVSIGGALLTGGSGNSSNCTIGVDMNWNGGNAGNWSTRVTSAPLSTTKGNLPPLGSASNTAAWGGHTWNRSDFDDADTNFRLRLTFQQTSCNSGWRANVDSLTVNVFYHVTTVTTTNNLLRGPGSGCANGLSDCYKPDGVALNARGFWGTMNTEGATNINGDAFQPYYDTGTTAAPPCPTAQIRACYDNLNYYNYAIDMPAFSTNGLVYIFDPGFCATAVNSGVGDRWFNNSNAVSSWYEIYDTNNTPYNILDDILITTSGGRFDNLDASDSTMGGSGGAECKQTDSLYGNGTDYHDSWYALNAGTPLTGGPDGTLYRLHTTGTNPANASAQRNANGEQSFAIFASASGANPNIYGLGAMQMFSPLELASGASGFSEFYIAQVPQAHAGKTLELSLWDPGDTNQLSANLQIEIPTSGGWSPVSMTWYSVTGTSGSPQNCTSYAQGQTAFSIPTNTGNGSTGVYNGCWLTIDVTIPVLYTAPQSGWWKIRYNMTNPTGSASTSFDVTTWTAKIRGNPVHLVLP